MKNVLKFLLMSLSLVLLANCVNVGYTQGLGPTGAAYSNYKFGTSYGDPSVKPTKEGKACVQRISFLFTSGEAGILDAAADGGIKKIHSVDKEGFGILGPYIYQRLCTVVTGE